MNVFTKGQPMRSELSGGVSFATIVCAVIALLLFVVAGWGWHRGWVQEHLRQPVLEKPIRFQEGFSLTSSFSVRYPSAYWVEVVCPKTNATQLNNRAEFRYIQSALSRQLPVTFTVACDGMIVAEGDSPGVNTLFAATEVTRFMSWFKGEAGKSYELSFRTRGAMPALDATKPMVRIGTTYWATEDPIQMLFSDTRAGCVIAAVGMLFALSPFTLLARKLFRHESNAA